MQFNVVAVGALDLDIILKIEDYPSRGETAFIKDIEKHIGGPAANFAVCTAKLGLKTLLLSKVGIDEEGKFLIKEISKYELLDTSHLIIDDQKRTSVVFSIVDKEGERTFFAFFENSAIADISENEIASLDSIISSRLLFCDGCLFFLEKPRSVLLKFMEAIRKSSCLKILFDPNLRTTGALPEDQRGAYLEALKFTNILSLGKEEVFLLTQESDLDVGIKKLLSLGPELIFVKLSSEGSLVVAANKKFHAPAFRTKGVDTTGAGDAYDAGVAYAYLKNLPLEQVAIFANAVGALKVTRHGAASGPYLEEVVDFLEKQGYSDLAKIVRGKEVVDARHRGDRETTPR